MIVVQEELVHPTQPSRVRLRVFAQEGGGFLVTEERVGTRTVYSSLGVFDSREAAEARLRERARELATQRYDPVPAPAA